MVGQTQTNDSQSSSWLRKLPLGDKTPESGEGVWVLGGLYIMFVGTSAGFAEFYFLESLRFISWYCNKDHSVSVFSLLTLSPSRSLLLFFLLSASPFLSVSSLSLSHHEMWRNFSESRFKWPVTGLQLYPFLRGSICIDMWVGRLMPSTVSTPLN